MNTLPEKSSHLIRAKRPCDVVLKLRQHQFSGCLKVVANDAAWCVYFDHGKLAYSTQLFDSLHQLRHLLRRIKVHRRESGTGEIFDLAQHPNVHEIFQNCEQESTESIIISPDYRIICWLLDKKYLSPKYGTLIANKISQESVLSLVQLSQQNCEVFPFRPDPSPRKLVGLNFSDLMAQVDANSDGASTTNGLQQRQSSRLVPVEKSSESIRKRRSPPQGQLPQTASLEPSDRKRPKYVIGCIDDSPAVLSNLKKCLSSDYFSVFTVNNPVKALMTIIRNQPDLLILDVMMPGVDGYELCSLLRKHPKFSAVPIIIITSNTGFVDRAKAKMVKASGYLNKPFTKQELLTTVGKYLSLPPHLSK